MLSFIRKLPGSLLAAFVAFLSVPLLAFYIFDDPASQIFGRSIVETNLLMMAFWFVPPALCLFLINRSIATLVLFAFECLALLGFNVMRLIDQPQSTDGVLGLVSLLAMIAVGALIINRDAVLPFANRDRSWRKQPRYVSNVRIGVSTIRDGDREETVLQDASLTGFGLIAPSGMQNTAAGRLLQKGDAVFTTMRIGAERVTAEARVEWLREMETFAALGVSVDDREVMVRFIRGLPPHPNKSPVRNAFDRAWTSSRIRGVLTAAWMVLIVTSVGLTMQVVKADAEAAEATDIVPPTH